MSRRGDTMVVLDTNVIIDYLVGKYNIVKVVDSFNRDELCITFVNEYELLKHKKRKILEDAIRNLKVYHSNDSATYASAKAYHSLKANGNIMSDNDLLIFGVCIANNEVLVTQDRAFEYLESEFIRIVK